MSVFHPPSYNSERKLPAVFNTKFFNKNTYAKIVGNVKSKPKPEPEPEPKPKPEPEPEPEPDLMLIYEGLKEVEIIEEAPVPAPPSPEEKIIVIYEDDPQIVLEVEELPQ